ncbi:tellurite resistance/C4-dicarboxylate transporter family protein [Leucobacter sp. HY1910]
MSKNANVHAAVARLSPGYFALVMATGIVSIGLHDVGAQALSLALLWIAAVAYAALWVLFIWRAIAFPHHVRRDLRNPEIAFAYFTVVAGTDVLGVRLAQAGAVTAATTLLFVGAGLWFVFGYLLPWQVLMTRDGHRILARTNGTWFIWAVASQSLAVGMSQIQAHAAPQAQTWIGMLAVLSWSVGVALYAGIALIVLLRIIHYGITPGEFEPPYWVAMGALAIAVVAGSGIVDMQSTPMVDATRELISGTVVVFWSFCVWLIPMLLGAGVWRHLVHRVPLRYVPTLWSMVFPMGMFAVASVSLGRADALPAVETIGHIALVIAALVWCAVFLAMLLRIAHALWAQARGGRATLEG